MFTKTLDLETFSTVTLSQDISAQDRTVSLKYNERTCYKLESETELRNTPLVAIFTV